MKHIRLARGYWTLAVALAGCGDASGGDAGIDAGRVEPCAVASDCDDGLFCDGAEICMPGAGSADEEGCVEGEPPCASMAECSESDDACAVCGNPDMDGDGEDRIECGGTDCDDARAEVFQGAAEQCDHIDQDCNPATLGEQDIDADGVRSDACCNLRDGRLVCGADCDDNRRGVGEFPEFCDMRDNDCDGTTDEETQPVDWYPDEDLDGFGDRDGVPISSCNIIPGRQVTATDCDDDNAAVHRGAAEMCNGRDDDCDGMIDEDLTGCADMDGGTIGSDAGTCALTMCGAECVDTDTSEAHCGGCDSPCVAGANATGAMCAGGDCVQACAAGYTSTGGACVVIAPPRPIGPLSTASTTSRRPRFYWSLAADTDGARLEICTTRDCSTIEGTFDVSGSSFAPPSELSPGVHFWRLFGRAGTALGTVASPTWQVYLPRVTAPHEGSWGDVADFNGDGLADLVASADLTARLHVYEGSASGWPVSPDRTITGSGVFGYEVSSAGDVDGDGFADLVVASPGIGIFVYRGSASGLSATRFTEISIGSGCHGVDGIGDVNGDGYADIAAGGDGTRQFYVYLGSSAGIGTTPITVTGPTGPATEFAWQITGGDLNGDRLGDVIVSAFRDTGGGRVFIYYSLGGAAPIPAVHDVMLSAPSGTGEFGIATAHAGDLNGDGYADVAVGNDSSSGLYVYYGGGAGIPSAAAMPYIGPEPYIGSSIERAGDVDGDGFGDLVVGGRLYNTGGTGTASGRAYLFYGSAAGISEAAGSFVIIASPDGAGSGFGYDVGAGDIDGDRYDDVVIGAYLSDSSGRARVYRRGSPRTLTLFDTVSGPDGAGSNFANSLDL